MANHIISKALGTLRLHPGSPDSVVNTWINDDIRPLPPSRRKWTTWTFLSWWAIWMMALANFQIGSSMVATGLSVWQAMVAVILGRIIIATMAVLNGYPGAEWHVGFPVFSRMVWGIKGSYGVIVLRILLGVVGFAVQSWMGGLCTTAVLSAIFPTYFRMRNTLPPSAHVTTSQLVGWFTFLLVCLPVIYVRPERAPKLMVVMNLLTLITLVSITIWSLAAAGGGGPLLSQPAMVRGSSQTGWAVVGGINNVIGTTAPALMSQPDFSRFARKPRDQIWGQVVAFVGLGTIMPLFGCLVASATAEIYGRPFWNPPELIVAWLMNNYQSGTRAAVAFAGLGMGVSQLATVVVDNAYALGMDLSAVFPKWINIRRGSYIGLVLGMAMCPWELLSTASTFLVVISSFTVFFGPICGIQVCDYFIIRQRRIKLSALYEPRPDAIYYYWRGFNWRPFVSWIVGVAPLFPGFLHAIEPAITMPANAANLYFIAFILGFAISFSVHYGLNTMFPPPGLGEVDLHDTFGTFTPEEAAALNISTYPSSENVDEFVDKVEPLP